MPTGLVLACIAACVVMYNFVPKYKASHLLEANHDYLVFEDVMPAIENLARSEKPILLNSVIIEAVLAKPEVRAVESLSDPMEAEPILREHLSVSSPGTDTQMVISYVDSNAGAAALVCNAVVASYMDKRQSLDTTRISNLERWLDPEIKRWEGIVEMQQEIVQKLSRANRGYEPGVNTPEDGYVPALNNLVGEITTIRIELAVMETTQSTEPASGDPQSTPQHKLFAIRRS
jgi:succinoglycan biosynthesis transport protein ExoP